MYIRTLHIEGYGILQDELVEDLSPGLVLFTGRNEGGKTTLMEFIRSVLFGFPSGRGRGANTYEPVRGGRRGGRLGVVMQDGRSLTIERVGRSVSIMDPGGEVASTDPSEYLFGGIDRQTFERIFAVGLRDLEGLDVLAEADVQGRLLAAGAGIGAKSVPEALRTLEGALDDLLKPDRKRVSQPFINDRRRELADVEREIGELSTLTQQYVDRQRDRVELRRHSEALRGEAGELQEQTRRLERLRQARGPWERLCQARENLGRLEHVERFPTDGIRRFEDAATAIELLETDRRRLADELEDLRRDRASVTVDEAILSQRERLEVLREQRSEFVSALHDLPVVEARRAEAQQSLARRLHELGPDWTADRLDAVDASVQTRQRALDFGRRLDGDTDARRRATDDVDRAREEVVACDEEASRATKVLESVACPLITEPDVLVARKAELRRLASLVNAAAARSAELSHARGELEDIDGQIAVRRSERDARGTVFLPRIERVLLAAGITAVVATAVLMWAGEPYHGVLALVLALGCLVGAALVKRIRARQEEGEADRVERIDDVLAELEVRRQVRDTTASDLARQGTEAEAEIGALAAASGVDPADGVAGVDDRQEEIERWTTQLAEWRSARADVDNAKARRVEAGRRLAAAEARLTQAAQAVEKSRDEWRQWVGQAGFSTDIEPDGFGEILQAVQHAREAVATQQEQGERVRQMHEHLAQVRGALSAVLEACGGTVGDEVALGREDLDGLSRGLEQAIQQAARRHGLDQEITAMGNELERCVTSWTERTGQRDALLQAAGVSDEESFRRAAHSHEEWVQYSKQRDDAVLELRTITGDAGDPEGLARELAEEDPAASAEERVRLTERLDAIQRQELGETERRIGELNRELDEMTQDVRLSELLQRRETLEAELERATQRWLDLAVCRYCLSRAQATYERERQPKVIREADRFLRTMTGREYRLIQQPGAAASIQLEDADLARRDEAHWSSGLGDQIYLSIRLGLAHEFAEHAEPLPVILDDILVRFDPERRLGALKALVELAREHQVLLFSCDEAVRHGLAQALASTPGDPVAASHYTISGGHLAQSALG